MAKYKLPSEDDAKRLKEMSEQLAKFPKRPDPTGKPQVNQPHDVYVAKLPADGIPAREGLFPGCAECEIWRLEEIVGSGTTGNCDPEPAEMEAVEIAGEPFAHVVYNLSTSAIGDEYALVLRDKYGSFFILTGGGSGVQIVRFELTDQIFCDLCQAQATVLSRPPGVTRVTGEDEYGEITVYDVSQLEGGVRGGWLNEPLDDLYRRRGYAVLLETDLNECAIDPNLTVKWEILVLVPGEPACGT